MPNFYKKNTKDRSELIRWSFLLFVTSTAIASQLQNDTAPSNKGAQETCSLDIFPGDSLLNGQCDSAPPTPISQENIITSPPLEQLIRLRSQSPLNHLISSLPIYVNYNVEDDGFHLRQVQTNCQLAFKEMIEETSFFPHLLQTETITILLITPADAYDQNSKGIYDPTHDVIGIVYRRGATVSDCKNALKNEFFSHQVAARNKLNGIKTKDQSYISLPCLDQNGGIDKAEFEKFKDAIEAGQNRIKYYRRLLNRKSLSNKARDELRKLQGSVNQYTPTTYSITLNQFKQALELGVLTEPDGNGYFQYGENHPKNLPLFYGQLHDGKVTYQHCRDNFSDEKMKAFIGDFIMRLEGLDSPDGPYGNMSKEKKLAEFGSFVSELPDELMKLVFPEFYDYMLNFFIREIKHENHNRSINYKSKSSSQISNSGKEKRLSNFFNETQKKYPAKKQATRNALKNPNDRYKFSAR